MQLILTIAALGAIATGLFIAFAPFNDQDRAIQDALAYEKKQADIARAIGGRR